MSCQICPWRVWEQSCLSHVDEQFVLPNYVPKKYSAKDLSAIIWQKHFKEKQNIKKLAQNSIDKRSG